MPPMGIAVWLMFIVIFCLCIYGSYLETKVEKSDHVEINTETIDHAEVRDTLMPGTWIP